MNSQDRRRASPPAFQPINRGRAIKCPDCALRLVAYACEQSIVYKCSSCHGLWFTDRKIANFREALSKFDLTSFTGFVHASESNSYLIAGCPQCHQVLDEIKYGYNTRVRIYRCERCRGVWLPLPQMVRLMESVKISQLIAPDVRGLLYELGIMEREFSVYQAWYKLGRILCSPLSGVDWREVLALLITN